MADVFDPDPLHSDNLAGMHIKRSKYFGLTTLVFPSRWYRVLFIPVYTSKLTFSDAISELLCNVICQSIEILKIYLIYLT